MANKTATLKNQAGDNIYPNIVGDNRNAAIKDSTTIKHTLVDNKISLDLDEAIKEKINAAAGGSSIPVVEGTEAELSTEEQAVGVLVKYTIPTAQTSPFILHTSDEVAIFVDVIDNTYSNIVVFDNDLYIVFGSDTVIYIQPYTSTSIYSTDIDGYLPTDETANVDVPFPAMDRITNSICVVSDRDNS